MTRSLPSLFIAVFVVAAGCRGSNAERKPEGAKTKTTTEGARTMTADLDVKQLQESLGPPIKPPVMPIDHAVRVLEEFAAAGPFAGPPASGEEVWYGRSYSAHADGNAQEGFLFVRLKADGTGFAAPLVPESGAEEGGAKGLLKALMKGEAPHPDSEAAKYIRSAPPRDGYQKVVKSDGVSTLITQASPQYLRQTGKKLLFVERLPNKSPNRRLPFYGAGRYAELWKLP